MKMKIANQSNTKSLQTRHLRRGDDGDGGDFYFHFYLYQRHLQEEAFIIVCMCVVFCVFTVCFVCLLCKNLFSQFRKKKIK